MAGGKAPLQPFLQVRTYRVNDVIIREGEPGEHFYILRSGGAAVSRSVGSGAKPQRIDYKYPGEQCMDGIRARTWQRPFKASSSLTCKDPYRR